jgi:hypothetical protein
VLRAENQLQAEHENQRDAPGQNHRHRTPGTANSRGGSLGRTPDLRCLLSAVPGKVCRHYQASRDRCRKAVGPFSGGMLRRRVRLVSESTTRCTFAVASRLVYRALGGAVRRLGHHVARPTHRLTPGAAHTLRRSALRSWWPRAVGMWTPSPPDRGEPLCRLADQGETHGLPALPSVPTPSHLARTPHPDRLVRGAGGVARRGRLRRPLPKTRGLVARAPARDHDESEKQEKDERRDKSEPERAVPRHGPIVIHIDPSAPPRKRRRDGQTRHLTVVWRCCPPTPARS